jgi:hypothetical protein
MAMTGVKKPAAGGRYQEIFLDFRLGCAGRGLTFDASIVDGLAVFDLRRPISIFTVRVLGFGNDTAGGGDATMPAQQSSVATPYDQTSLVQLVGHGGAFNAEQAGRLTADERRKLLLDR